MCTRICACLSINVSFYLLSFLYVSVTASPSVCPSVSLFARLSAGVCVFVCFNQAASVSVCRWCSQERMKIRSPLHSNNKTWGSCPTKRNC